MLWLWKIWSEKKEILCELNNELESLDIDKDTEEKIENLMIDSEEYQDGA